jgi:hypothetical protein
MTLNPNKPYSYRHATTAFLKIVAKFSRKSKISRQQRLIMVKNDERKV